MGIGGKGGGRERERGKEHTILGQPREREGKEKRRKNGGVESLGQNLTEGRD